MGAVRHGLPSLKPAAGQPANPAGPVDTRGRSETPVSQWFSRFPAGICTLELAKKRRASRADSSHSAQGVPLEMGAVRHGQGSGRVWTFIFIVYGLLFQTEIKIHTRSPPAGPAKIKSIHDPGRPARENKIHTRPLGRPDSRIWGPWGRRVRIFLSRSICLQKPL